MTCREKLKMEHPDWTEYELNHTFHTECPDAYIDIKTPRDEAGKILCGKDLCEQCWNREIPDTNSNECITTTNEKEKNMATTKKTKAELMEELENVKKSKEELEKELKNLEKYKQYEDMAGEVHAIYMSFVHAGFSEEQAYDLLKTMIQNAGNITFNTSTKPTYRDYYKR